MSPWSESPDAPDLVLLERYFLGECTAAESARIRAWADARQERQAALETLRRMRPTAVSQDWATEEGWADMQARLTGAGMVAPAKAPKRVRAGHGSSAASPRTSRVSRSRIVVAFALCAVAAFAITRFWRSEFASEDRPVVTRSYATESGQRATVTLPDGSQIMLAPRTRLQFSQSRGGARTVSLDGQAQFTVAADPARPFVVRTGAVQTRVIGTRFDIRYYPGDSVTQIAVLSGKVASSGRGRPVILTAGASARVTDSAGTVLPPQDLDALTAWTRGQLAFTDAPVRDLLAAVGIWFDYEFRLADTTLAAQHVTIRLSGDDRAETLRILTGLLGVEMQFDGHVVHLQPRRTSRFRAPATPAARDTFTHLEQEVGR